VGRPRTIDIPALLAATRAVFTEKGLRATTADIARAAGVAEGTLFHHFRTKEDLVRAALVPAGEPPWAAALPARVGRSTVEEELTSVAQEIVVFFRQVLPLVMLSWSNQPPGRLPNLLTQPDPPPLRALKRLTGYFEAEMRLGRLRRHDPEIVARAFLGGVQSFVMFELVLAAQEELPLPVDTFVRGFVRLLLAGAGPAHDSFSSTRSSKSRSRRSTAGTAKAKGERP
jgi:AcrR family transcriptional regulator